MVREYHQARQSCSGSVVEILTQRARNGHSPLLVADEYYEHYSHSLGPRRYRTLAGRIWGGGILPLSGVLNKKGIRYKRLYDGEGGEGASPVQ